MEKRGSRYTQAKQMKAVSACIDQWGNPDDPSNVPRIWLERVAGNFQLIDVPRNLNLQDQPVRPPVQQAENAEQAATGVTNEICDGTSVTIKEICDGACLTEVCANMVEVSEGSDTAPTALPVDEDFDDEALNLKQPTGINELVSDGAIVILGESLDDEASDFMKEDCRLYSYNTFTMPLPQKDAEALIERVIEGHGFPEIFDDTMDCFSLALQFSHGMSGLAASAPIKEFTRKGGEFSKIWHLKPWSTGSPELQEVDCENFTTKNGIRHIKSGKGWGELELSDVFELAKKAQYSTKNVVWLGCKKH